jgi:hypothetical protein
MVPPPVPQGIDDIGSGVLIAAYVASALLEVAGIALVVGDVLADRARRIELTKKRYEVYGGSRQRSSSDTADVRPVTTWRPGRPRSSLDEAASGRGDQRQRTPYCDRGHSRAPVSAVHEQARDPVVRHPGNALLPLLAVVDVR